MCEPLAIGIVRGGEGATKLMTVRVTGAKTDDGRADRRARDRQLAAGQDGDARRRSELGPARGRRRPRPARTFVLERARVRVGPVELFANGAPFDERAPEAAEYLQGKDIAIEVDLGTGGSGRAQMWTCDLRAEYVRINAEYRT